MAYHELPIITFQWFNLRCILLKWNHVKRKGVLDRLINTVQSIFISPCLSSVEEFPEKLSTKSCSAKTTSKCNGWFMATRSYSSEGPCHVKFRPSICPKSKSLENGCQQFGWNSELDSKWILGLFRLWLGNGKRIRFWDDVWPCHSPQRCMP